MGGAVDDGVPPVGGAELGADGLVFLDAGVDIGVACQLLLQLVGGFLPPFSSALL